MRVSITIVAIAIFGILAYATWLSIDSNNKEVTALIVPDGALAIVSLPESFSQNAQIGKRGFEAKCASCHGVNASGQDGVAPPLVHIIYEPNHHADESFQRAVAMGVSAHHWHFGNMPAIADVTRGNVKMIVAYIRELQRTNGIN